MKNSNYLNLIFALSRIQGPIHGYPSNDPEPRKEITTVSEAEKEFRLEQIKKKQGLTEFYYNGESVWALNRKSADKKAKKKGYT
jgi:hypothetical protein